MALRERKMWGLLWYKIKNVYLCNEKNGGDAGHTYLYIWVRGEIGRSD